MKVFNMIKKAFFLSFIFVFLIMLPFQARSQYFNVYDISVQNYPEVKAKFAYIDSNGRFISKNNNEEFNIQENQESADIVDIKWPRQVNPRKLSVVLVFDVSSSMTNERLSIAKSAAKHFVDLLPLDISECAVSSFDHLNYLNIDFSHSREKIKDAIDELSPQGGTNYNSGFTYPYSGSLKVVKKGLYKKIIIFLTDGLGEGNEEEIIREAKETGATVFPITIEMQAPSVLKNIAKETGGIYYENITSSREANRIYKRILYNAQTIQYGEITWLSTNGCRRDISVKFGFNQDTVVSSYSLPLEKQSRLNINPYYLQFENRDSMEEIEVQVKAVNEDFTIHNITFDQSKKFRVPQSNLPLNIPKGKSEILTFYLDTARKGKNFTRVSLENNVCPDYHLYAMNSENYSTDLKLEYPNGGEIFSVGVPVKIQWKGIHKRDSVELYFSFDGGRQWTSVGKSAGLSHKWETPAKPSERCKIKVIQGKHKAKKKISYMFSLSGNKERAHYAKILKNGEFIVTAEKDHNVRLWSGKTGRFIRSFPIHKQWVYGVTESPDGNRLVSASDDGTSKVFYPQSGQGSLLLEANSWGINDARFTHNGRYILTAGDDGAIRAWDAHNGKHLFKMMGHQGWVRNLAISHNNRYAISGGDDNTVRIWDLASGSLQMTLLGHTDWVTDVDFKPDGSRVASSSKDSSIIIWNSQSGKMINYINGHKGQVNTVNYSPDGNTILSSSKDGTFRVWDSSTGEQEEVVVAPDHKYFRTAFFGPGGNRIITTDSEGETSVWVYDKTGSVQEDVSDHFFSIVNPTPEVKDIYFGQLPVRSFNDTIVSGFLRNYSKFPVYIKDIQPGKEANEHFTLVSSFKDRILNPGDSSAIEISYHPKDLGIHTGKINVITLTGTIPAKVEGEGMKTQYELINDRIDFGESELGEYKDTSVAILRNTGNTSITIDNLKIQGAGSSSFKMEEELQQKELKPGKTWSVNAGYYPKDKGRVTGQINFMVNKQTREIILLFGESASVRQIMLRGTVFNSIDSLPLSVNVTAYDHETNRSISSLRTNKEGEFYFQLNQGRRYRILAEKENYIPSSIHVDLSNEVNDAIERNIYISPIKPGSSVRLNNIFFDFGKSKLTKSSKAELDRLVRFLKEHPTLEIEIEGHTDHVGQKHDNLKLSRDRAMSVRDYMVNKGIEQNRLNVKGYGESMPVAPNDTEQGRARNRRVEFKISE